MYGFIPIELSPVIGAILPVRSKTSATFDVQCLLVSLEGMMLADEDGFFPLVFLEKLRSLMMQEYLPLETTSYLQRE